MSQVDELATYNERNCHLVLLLAARTLGADPRHIELMDALTLTEAREAAAEYIRSGYFEECAAPRLKKGVRHVQHAVVAVQIYEGDA